MSTVIKKIIILFLTIFAGVACAGCSTEIKPDTAEQGTYGTQNKNTALEYSIYMNKQITNFANQLTTRLTMINNHEDSQYENEIELTEQSIEIMEDILEQVTVTNPSVNGEDDRESVILAMETSVEHMKDYRTALENQTSVKGFADEFQNDFNALTGLANLYYQ